METVRGRQVVDTPVLFYCSSVLIIQLVFALRYARNTRMTVLATLSKPKPTAQAMFNVPELLILDSKKGQRCGIFKKMSQHACYKRGVRR